MAKSRVINSYFERSELEVNPYVEQRELSDNQQLTLSRLLGFDEPSQTFRLIRVGADGRVLVATDAVKVTSGVISKVSVGVAAVLLLAANTSRKGYVIANTATATLYIGYTSTLTTVNGFPINPGSYYSDDVYVGEIWGVYLAAGNPDVAVNEV